jgi:protoporphyrinogen oxidase
MKIAIIGAGVSGLATAHYLKKYLPSTEIHIYEKGPVVGGNANTFHVTLENGSHRWVDMGVNDFNKATYKELDVLWQELNIMDSQLQSAYCSPLINSASYSVANDPYRYTIDNQGNVNAPSGSTAHPSVITDGMKNFKINLANWFQQDPPDYTTSVGDWIAQQGFTPEFIWANLYPRMNGMYFTMEKGPAGFAPPAQMPMWMVAHYYILQEGYGNPESEQDI